MLEDETAKMQQKLETVKQMMELEKQKRGDLIKGDHVAFGYKQKADLRLLQEGFGEPQEAAAELASDEYGVRPGKQKC